MRHIIIKLALLFFCVSCDSTRVDIDRSASLNSPPTKQNSSASTSDQAIKKISALLIDEPMFRIKKVRVGLQDFMQSQTPYISISAPPISDYVQIIRCLSHIPIQGYGGDLRQLDIDHGNSEQITQAMQSSDYWSRAAEQAGCFLISKSLITRTKDAQGNHIETHFYDASAPSGSYLYLVRACVDLERLIHSEQLGNRNCSKQIGVSTLLENYVNQRSAEEKALYAAVASAKAEVDAYGLSTYYLAVKYGHALQACETKERNKLIVRSKKEALGTLIGTGVTFGVDFLGGMIQQQISMGTVFANSAMSLLQAGFMATQVSLGKSFGSPLANAINAVFYTAEDESKTCYSATTLRRQGEVIARKLETASAKSSQELFRLAAFAEKNKKMETGWDGGLK